MATKSFTKKIKKNQTYNIQNANILHAESLCLPSSYHLSNTDIKNIGDIT